MSRSKRIWDLPVRLLHWLLVLCIAAAWITSDETGPLHEYIGYAAAAIVAARVTWGFAGNGHARFAGFVVGVRPTLAYARQVATGTAPRYLGHNPLGAAMVIALLGCVALVAFSGYLTTTDLLWGYAWPVLVHEALAWTLVALIAGHIAGVAFTSWHQRENLVGAMFTGDKPADTQAGGD